VCLKKIVELFTGERELKEVWGLLGFHKMKKLLITVAGWIIQSVWRVIPMAQLGYILAVLSEVGNRELARQIECLKSIDRNIIGRYCGSLEDKMMQSYFYLKALHYFPSNPKYAHIEIGVLFGGSILLKLSLLKRFAKKQTVIAIDPLEGYYKRGSIDPKTQVEVNEENFRKNISSFGFDGSRLKLINKLSTDRSIVGLVSGYTVATLFIDGDHSYKGIKHDWDTFSPLVAQCGYVIFDDYNEPGWADVTSFVDEIIRTRSNDWRLVGCLDTTLVLQRL